jgi:hypothetical protein
MEEVSNGIKYIKIEALGMKYKVFTRKVGNNSNVKFLSFIVSYVQVFGVQFRAVSQIVAINEIHSITKTLRGNAFI